MNSGTYGHGGVMAAWRRGGASFGLIALLITMAIILYLMFGNMGGGSSYADKVNKTRKQGRETANEISTQQMTLLIAMYRQNNQQLPKIPADLESPGAFNDQWGQEMTFTFETVRGKTTVTYHSIGPDGEPNTEDDLKRTDTLPY